MKKVNLKGKLSLKKETMSKMELNEVNGGATIGCTGTASLLVICGQSVAFCPTLFCVTRNPACIVQSRIGCPTTGPLC
jgi:hypothetical protein